MIKKKYTYKNFIYKIIEKDIFFKKIQQIKTRFPPEPNGYLHIGHAKSMCLNFGIAKKYNGQCNLRFDDTNPIKKYNKYINSIIKDINWLGFNFNNKIYYSSDYFEILYNYALELIQKGLAYVDNLSKEEIKQYRGTLNIPGKNSPYRNRNIEENKKLFYKMRNGYFNEGAACLRAKINMKSPFMIMRDPILYRIKFANHHRTKNKWCIYTTYDFTHCISDAIEGITHSLCTLEFQDNRRLYEWILKNISINTYPCQYEFSRLNLEYNIMSKRKIKILVKKKIVDGWDDPRLPTISGLRRRGYTAKSIIKFCKKIGITKKNTNIEITRLESCIREDLNNKAPRLMAVIDPLKLIILTLPIGYEYNIKMLNFPKNPKMGNRKVLLTREIYIDKNDFREINKINYNRLTLGKKIKLRNAYIIKAKYIKKNKKGKIISVYCIHYPNTLNKYPKKKKLGIIHWVSKKKNIPAEFRIYNNLFNKPNPNFIKNYLSIINPNSLIIYNGFIEYSIILFNNRTKFQFERKGYFIADNRNFTISHPIYNRIVKLKQKK